MTEPTTIKMLRAVQLTPEASAALERVRELALCTDKILIGDQGWVSREESDCELLAREMLRLFPLGHDAEITQERWSRTGIDKPAAGNEHA